MKVPFFTLLARAAVFGGVTGGLLGCDSGATAGSQAAVARAAGGTEPTVLSTVRHYARVLTQDVPVPLDSLRRYRGLAVEPDVLPGRYRLRLRTHTVILAPESPGSTVSIEPAERTRSLDPAPGGPRSERPAAVVPSRANPALAVQLGELTAAFGPWNGDEYDPPEAPMAPAMHMTELRYTNPATGRRCRLFVYLKNAPSAATNAVHEISFVRDARAP